MKKLKYKYGGPGDDKLYQANLPEVTVRSKKESPYKLTVTDRKSYENSFQDTPKTLQEKKD